MIQSNYVFSCAFNSSRPRWSNTPVPNPNSCIHFFGTIADINSAGIVRVDVENIALNVGPTSTNETVSSPNSPASPVKRRKFNAIAANLPQCVFFFSFSHSVHIVYLSGSSSPQCNIPSSSIASFTDSSVSVPMQPTPSSSQLIPMGPVPTISSPSSSETTMTAPGLTSNALPLALHDTLSRFVHLLFHTSLNQKKIDTFIHYDHDASVHVLSVLNLDATFQPVYLLFLMNHVHLLI